MMTILTAIATATSAVGQPDFSIKDDPKITDAQIQQWVADLDSDRFFDRRNATEQLIQVGGRAIPVITKAVEGSSLETISRCIYILRELASSTEFDTESKAYAALEKIAEKKVTLAARRAASTLSGLGELRERRAREYLSKKGAVLTEDYVRVTDLVPKSFPCVVFGTHWRGNVDDLRHLNWVVGRSPPDAPTLRQSNKWLVTMDGEKIDDEYLAALKTIPGISAIKIRKTKISDNGLAQLKEFKELLYLDLLYNPLTEEAVPHLSELKSLARIRLFGSRLPNEQVEKLQAALAQCDIDYRDGAFLGISCTSVPPCKVESIVPNSAADLAGLQPNDTITAYRGKPVESFSQLVKLIGENSPGETVDVDILRQGEEKSIKVKLGEWD